MACDWVVAAIIDDLDVREENFVVCVSKPSVTQDRVLLATKVDQLWLPLCRITTQCFQQSHILHKGPPRDNFEASTRFVARACRPAAALVQERQYRGGAAKHPLMLQVLTLEDTLLSTEMRETAREDGDEPDEAGQTKHTEIAWRAAR